MKQLLVVVLTALALLGGGAWWADDRLDHLHGAVATTWAEADQAITRRADLVTPVITLVNRHNRRDQLILQAAEDAVKQVKESREPAARMEASDKLSSALGRLLLASDAYLALKDDPEYLQDRANLLAAENDLTIARRNYNNAAQNFNASLRAFPGNVFGRWIGYEEAPYFKPGRQVGIEKGP